MTVNTKVMKILLQSNVMPYIEIKPGLRLQVLPDISSLSSCQKHQFAAFIADPGILVVWDDEPEKIISRAERLEAALLSMIWGEPGMTQEGQGKHDGSILSLSETRDVDPEILAEEKPRRIVLMQSWVTAATLILTVSAIGAGWRQVAIEIAVDGGLIRILFILVFLPQAWLALVSPTSSRREGLVKLSIDSSSSRPSSATSPR
jgi:hypothetical protein